MNDFYFNYHAEIKKKILDGKLLYYEVVDKYNSISPALVLYFSEGRPMPIRQYKWDEYFELIKSIK